MQLIPGHNETKIESRSNEFKISHHFYEYFTKQPEWPMNTSSSVMKMHCGKVLSGNYLTGNKRIKELLENFASDAIGIEMESAGLFLDYEESDHRVLIMLVKALCDFGDGKNKNIGLLQCY